MSAQIDFNLHCMAITLPDKSQKSLLNKSFKIVLRVTKILKKKNEISFKDLKKYGYYIHVMLFWQ